MCLLSLSLEPGAFLKIHHAFAGAIAQCAIVSIVLDATKLGYKVATSHENPK
jgi:ABC-type uncharacterized transport system permease subunit